MKFRILAAIFISLNLLLISCDEVYDYDVNDTTWDIYVFWAGFYQGEPTSITFNSDGTTSWGGTWKKIEELAFIWTINYTDSLGVYTASYYAYFKENLNELKGHCENTRKYSGEFFAYKKRQSIQLIIKLISIF